MVFPQIDHASYLAAIIDGEGSVQASFVGPRKQWIRGVQIANQDPDILIAIVECLDALGIEWRSCVRVTNGFSDKEITVIYIYGRENYEKLRKLPVQGAKREKIEALCNSYLTKEVA